VNEIIQRLSDRLSDVRDLVSRTNKSSVLVIQQFPLETDTATLIPAVRESVSNILAFIELGEVQVLEQVIQLADGAVDIVLFDDDLKCQNSEELINMAREGVRKSRLFFYSDYNTWADSAMQLIQQVVKGLKGKKVLLSGEGSLKELMLQKLLHANALVNTAAQGTGEVSMYAANEFPDCIIGASIKTLSLADEKIAVVTGHTFIFDVGIGNFSRNFISEIMQKGAGVYRVDIRAGISSTVLGILETDYLIRNIMGRTVLNGVEIVAGGYMGQKGAIIVDDISRPSYIIGVADGQGNVMVPGESDRSNIEFITRLIGRNNEPS
jgi:hypothetical protein